MGYKQREEMDQIADVRIYVLHNLALQSQEPGSLLMESSQTGLNGWVIKGEENDEI